MLKGYKIVTYCTTRVFEDHFYDFIQTFNNTLEQNGWRILVFAADNDLYNKTKVEIGQKAIYDLINWDITDILLVSNEDILDPSLVKRLLKTAKEKSIPSILFAGDSPTSFNIKFDDNAGFKKVVNHILDEHKITDVHFMNGIKDAVQSQDRLAAFKSCLKAHKIKFNESMISYGDYWDLPARVATKKLINENRLPKAIICANDAMALAVVDELDANGISCPKDVLVTGFDGIDSIFYSSPKITSCLCDYKNLGKQTADLVLKIDSMTEEEKNSPETIYIEPTLIISESCGCKEITPVNAIHYISSSTNNFIRYHTEERILNDLSVGIQSCTNVHDVIQKLDHNLLYNMVCIVKDECIDATLNPEENYTTTTYGENLYVLADSDYDEESFNRNLKVWELIPRMEVFLTQYHKPIIFIGMNNRDLPLGYLAFCFTNYDKQNYAKVGQIATTIGNALSSFRNMQYQHFLQTRIEKMYKYDSLTGLYNRNGFLKEYDSFMEDDNLKYCSLVMCDLDNLKYINDNFSHNEGDNAIYQVGKALFNSYPGGIFCRYGGDEIIGLFTSNSKEGCIDAEFVKNRINSYLNEYNKTSEKQYTVTTSIGIYSCKKTNFETLFTKADELMYIEKQNKKKNKLK